jgi:hypothetical protein
VLPQYPDVEQQFPKVDPAQVAPIGEFDAQRPFDETGADVLVDDGELLAEDTVVGMVVDLVLDRVVLPTPTHTRAKSVVLLAGRPANKSSSHVLLPSQVFHARRLLSAMLVSSARTWQGKSGGINNCKGRMERLTHLVVRRYLPEAIATGIGSWLDLCSCVWIAHATDRRFGYF